MIQTCLILQLGQVEIISRNIKAMWCIACVYTLFLWPEWQLYKNAKPCNGPVKLDTKLLFESVDDYQGFCHWASNSAGVR